MAAGESEELVEPIDDELEMPEAGGSGLITRRRALGAGAVTAVGGGLAAWLARNSIVRWYFSRSDNDVALSSASSGGDICVVTPDQIEGPYYIQAPFRTDVREDRVGLDFDIDIEVVSLPDCEPLAGATIEIWHCDAEGNYSGYQEGIGHQAFETFIALVQAGGDHVDPINDKTYLRGAQTSDAAGRVRFQTIFPGWYDPRVTHIHLKVTVGDQPYITTQLYFPDELIERIYREDERYEPFGACPYNLGNDFVIGDLEDGTGLLLDPADSGDRLNVAFRVGVTPT